MTERPGPDERRHVRSDSQRQDDLDWLYDSTARPAQSPRPRVTTEPYADDSASGQQAARIGRTSAGDRSGRREAQGNQARSGAQPGYRGTSGARSAGSRPSEARQSASRAGHADARNTAGRPPAARDPRDRAGDAARTSPRPRKRRGRRALRLLRLVVILLVAWLAWLIGVPLYAAGHMQTVDESQSTDRPSTQPGTAVLLVGTDSREGLSEAEREELGTGDAAGSRADTIMLLYRPISGPSVLVSLPRDSYVSIPGYGQGKLNASYAYGGPALLTETVELATGVQLDGYLEIGFGGFASVVDAVGGVDVCLDAPMQDEYANIDLPAGCQTLDGANALGYVRQRYQDPEGDIGRAKRQREVMGQVASKVASPATVLNPFRYWRINMAAKDMLTRGDETGTGDLIGAARALIDVSSGDGLSLVVPISDPAGVTDDGQSVVVWNHDDALAMFDEISQGDTSQLSRFAS
ncbi:LCP family protein [Brooklawnia cerclae]|uniref:LCP family protein required for cell wall assembly n=1 Tax=Brooklawnia cerclae TaxID=349934 RepID=A0ABX0SCC5_9ACTN|nr:LCP family protein [Brooklawnia cerclae]NIH55974.1 LCP family protein required for cell wall assembly [Brooklawnia cerclae]